MAGTIHKGETIMSDANIQELRFGEFADNGYWDRQPKNPKKRWSKKMWRNLITECEKITGHHINIKFNIPENNELEDFEELFEI